MAPRGVRAAVAIRQPGESRRRPLRLIRIRAMGVAQAGGNGRHSRDTMM
ncbi:MAG TPA: hypothetical protein G4O02_15935 [Caldilineae bacterium]|nr:hypothetical protein [Caldilineae bacterium]